MKFNENNEKGEYKQGLGGCSSQRGTPIKEDWEREARDKQYKRTHIFIPRFRFGSRHLT